MMPVEYVVEDHGPRGWFVIRINEDGRRKITSYEMEHQAIHVANALNQWGVVEK